MSAIDLTDLYHSSAWMTNFPRFIDRREVPYQNYIVHHAGYATGLTSSSTRAQEEAVIHNIASFHIRPRSEGGAGLGIGPGYNELIAPSGRRYAVGKVGTKRRHTSNPNPATGRTWNWDGYAACYMQNAELVQPTEAALKAFEASIRDVRGWTQFTRPDLKIMGHRDSGFSTACPGKNLYSHLDRFRAVLKQGELKMSLTSQQRQVLEYLETAQGKALDVSTRRQMLESVGLHRDAKLSDYDILDPEPDLPMLPSRPNYDIMRARIQAIRNAQKSYFQAVEKELKLLEGEIP